MTHAQSTNAAWLERASVVAGSSLAGYRLPSAVDFVVAEASGSRIRDVDGREYIDFLIGSGPMILGHAHPAVVEAVADHLGRGSTYYMLNTRAIELAERIVAASPCAERVRYTSTGGEATAFAIRLARGFTGRAKVLKFEGGYHGSSDVALMSFAPNEPTSFPEPQPDSAGITDGVASDVLVAPYNDVEQTRRIATEHASDLAAIIVEPQQRCIPPHPDFLPALREIADQAGALLIFDEVVTGFRLAWGGAQEFYGVTPDLAAYGKIIGGGYPLAAVAGPARVMDLTDTALKGRPNYVHFSGTLNGNPIASVAGLATLNELDQPGSYERLDELGTRLRRGLAEAAERRRIPLSVIGQGPLAALHFTDRQVTSYRDVLGADKQRLARANAGLVKRGILAQLSTKFYLSLAHSDDDVDRCVEAFDEVLGEIDG
jgi:glutamate-1-semialdehyde 2,1-aminomutase